MILCRLLCQFHLILMTCELYFYFLSYLPGQQRSGGYGPEHSLFLAHQKAVYEEVTVRGDSLKQSIYNFTVNLLNYDERHDTDFSIHQPLLATLSCDWSTAVGGLTSQG